MNKLATITVLIVFCFINIRAQDSIKLNTPQLKFGILAGMSFNRMEAIDLRFKNLTINPINTSIIGIFVDKSIENDAVSFRLEPSYMQSSYSLTTYSAESPDQNETDIIMNQKTLLIPALLRLNGFHAPVGLFLEAGIVYSYNFENSWEIYNTRNNQGVIELTLGHDDDLNANHLMGLCLGAGINIKLYNRHWMYLNARISRVVPQEGTGEFRYYYPQLMAGVVL